MAQTIKLKRSATSGNVPTTAQLELGELAINTFDGKIYIKKNNGTASVVEIGSAPSGYNNNNWDSAYNWGNHADAGYLTSYTDTNTTYTTATSSVLGLVKIGYSENGKNYPVELSNGQMYVNVPWIDTDTNTWRGIHDTPVDGATTTSISSNWAFDNVKKAVPANALFTDTIYTHPIHPGDDFSVDTGALTGATVVSDIDINVTTDSLGHVTDANGVVSTRTLTLSDLGYTGATNANNFTYTHPTHPGDDLSVDTGPLTGATVISDLDFNVTTDTLGHVTDANATVATRTLTAANIGAAPASHSHSNYLLTTGKAADSELLDGLDLHTGRNNEANKVVRTDASGYIQAGWINTTSGVTTGTSRIYASNDSYLRYVTNDTFRNNLGLWWSGNDGSGSGLDADLLDGVQGSGYAKAQGRVVTDCNSYRTPGMYGFVAAPANGPGESYGAMIVAANIDTGLQIAGGYSNRDLYFRGWASSGSTFYPWDKVWHTGNDGSGSGLDADLLDGQQGSYYYPKSGGTIAGAAQITFSGNNYFEINSSNSGEAMTRYNNTVSNLWYTGIRSSTQLVGNTGYHIYSAAHGQTSFGITSDGYVKGARAGTFWGSSNDGSGSGLDADLLDGLQGTSFLRDDGWNNSPGQDANTQTPMRSDFTYSNNAPHTGELIRFGASNYSLQLNSSYGSSGNGFSFRTNNGDGGAYNWNPWKTIWHSGNDGSGSGLDADLLDGKNASSSGGANQILASHPTNGYLYINNWIHPANGTGLFYDAGVHFHESGNKMYSSTAFHSAQQGLLWGASNDGSGSGLDADLLDGQQGSYYATASHNHTGTYLPISGKAVDSDLLDGVDSSRVIYGSNGTGTTSNTGPSATLKSGIYDVYNNNTPTATWYSYINLRHNNTGNNYGHQIAGSFYDNSLWNRNINNNTFGAWNKNWSSNNDGSGSGLDADLLDGLDSTAFLRATGGTVSGNLAVTGNLTTQNGWVDAKNAVKINGTTVIDSSRNLTNVGTISASGSSQILGELNIRENASAPGYTFLRFQSYSTGGTLGSVYRQYGTMYYSTSSDYRLKENVVPLLSAVDRVNALKPKRFNFIEYKDQTIDGFIAHEVESIVPEAVLGVKDAVDDNRNPTYQSIDHGKLVPLLTAGLQEALAEIEKLKARLSALEN